MLAVSAAAGWSYDGVPESKRGEGKDRGRKSKLRAGVSLCLYKPLNENGADSASMDPSTWFSVVR